MKPIRRIFLTLASLALTTPALAVAQSPPKHVPDLPWPTGTFSILAYDPATGELGGAVQSRVFSVGNGVLSAEAGVGVVATQAIVDVSYGPQALELLRQGMDAEHVVKTVWDRDPDPRPDDWSKQGRQFAVVDSMVAFFERTPGHLAYRLLAAPEGGQLAGGDKRGQQSAAMVIVKKDAGVWLHNDTLLRLQVDDNPEPIKELRRLVEKAAAQRRIPKAP